MPLVETDVDQAAEYIQQVGRESATDKILQQKKADGRDASAESTDSDAESWMTASNWTVNFLDKKLCPAWELDDGEKVQLASSLADVLDLYFPGAMRGFDNWHPLSKLFGSMMMIAAMRVDLQTGRIAPMHHKATTDNGKSEPERRHLDLNGGDDSERKNPGRFTTHGE